MAGPITPTDIAGIPSGGLAPIAGQPVRASGMAACIEDGHWMRARLGRCLWSRGVESPTGSATLVALTDATVHTSEIQGGLTVTIYGQAIEVEVTVTRGVDVATVTVTQSGVSPAFASGTIGSAAPLGTDVDILVEVAYRTTGALGVLSAITICETDLTL